VLLAILLPILVALGVVIGFERQLTLTLLNPDRTYEAYDPPPPAEYDEPEAWFRFAEGEGDAAAFVVHANVFRGSEDWNAPVDGTEQEDFLREVQVRADTAPFEGFTEAYVPRYRQPTMFARFTQKHPGAASRLTAYGDVERAFLAMLEATDAETPLILTGYDDGALLIGKLWLDLIEPNAELRERVVAVYAVGMPLARAAFAEEVCANPGDIRCVIGFTPVDERFGAYKARLRTRTLILGKQGRFDVADGTAKLCAPPPLPEEVEALGRGGAGIPFEHQGECVDGLFVHATPPPELRRPKRFGGPWYPDGNNLFASAIREDAQRRLDRWRAVRTVEEIAAQRAAEEARLPPPMEPAEDLREVPVNTVPSGF
jgi:hypothetical protein